MEKFLDLWDFSVKKTTLSVFPCDVRGEAQKTVLSFRINIRGAFRTSFSVIIICGYPRIVPALYAINFIKGQIDRYDQDLTIPARSGFFKARRRSEARRGRRGGDAPSRRDGRHFRAEYQLRRLRHLVAQKEVEDALRRSPDDNQPRALYRRFRQGWRGHNNHPLRELRRPHFGTQTDTRGGCKSVGLDKARDPGVRARASARLCGHDSCNDGRAGLRRTGFHPGHARERPRRVGNGQSAWS